MELPETEIKGQPIMNRASLLLLLLAVPGYFIAKKYNGMKIFWIISGVIGVYTVATRGINPVTRFLNMSVIDKILKK